MARLPPRYPIDRPDTDLEPAHSGKTVRWAAFWLLMICGVTAVSGLAARIGMPILTAGLSRPVTASIAVQPPAPKQAKAPAPTASSQTYRADASGHFFVDARVNGALIHFLVDTGATVVALTPDDARAAGVLNGMLNYTLPVQTADGIAHAAPVTLREIVLGQSSEQEVPAIIMEKPATLSLLGMSFLRRFNYEVRDQQLILYW